MNRYTTLQSSLQNFFPCSQLWIANERLALSGVLRQKASPLVLRHGIDDLRRQAINGTIIGIGLLAIGGCFIFLCLNHFTPVPLLYPIIVLILSVMFINLVNFGTIMKTLRRMKSVGALLNNIESHRKELELANSESSRKKYKVSITELLLMLCDSGFTSDIYSAIRILSSFQNPISSTDLMDVNQQIVKENKHITESLQQVCKELQIENKIGGNGSLTARLKTHLRLQTIDIVWEILSLLLNSLACLFFISFPLCTFLPFDNLDSNRYILYAGNVFGNACWMVEALVYVFYLNFRQKSMNVVSFEKKNT